MTISMKDDTTFTKEGVCPANCAEERSASYGEISFRCPERKMVQEIYGFW
jgi:hypothetical protein